MSTDQNVNAAGQPTWEFYSHPGFCKVTDYATYQAQTFKYSLKGEYISMNMRILLLVKFTD